MQTLDGLARETGHRLEFADDGTTIHVWPLHDGVSRRESFRGEWRTVHAYLNGWRDSAAFHQTRNR